MRNLNHFASNSKCYFSFVTTASQSGNVGVVHYLEKKADFDWLLETGPDAPYVVLLPPDLFRRFEFKFCSY
jgi:hypothetical protein